MNPSEENDYTNWELLWKHREKGRNVETGWNAATLSLTDQTEKARVNLGEMNDKKMEMEREIHLAKIREVRMKHTCLNLQWR